MITSMILLFLPKLIKQLSGILTWNKNPQNIYRKQKYKITKTTKIAAVPKKIKYAISILTSNRHSKNSQQNNYKNNQIKIQNKSGWKKKITTKKHLTIENKLKIIKNK